MTNNIATDHTSAANYHDLVAEEQKHLENLESQAEQLAAELEATQKAASWFKPKTWNVCNINGAQTIAEKHRKTHLEIGRSKDAIKFGQEHLSSLTPHEYHASKAISAQSME